jgi:cell division septation protein DedD
MSTTYREEEEEYEQAPQSTDADLTISGTTLLVLFFCLVLLCGVFFGLGYTLGRRDPGVSNALSPAASAASSGNSHGKPAPTSEPIPQPTTVAAGSGANQSSDAGQGSVASQTASSAPVPQAETPTPAVSPTVPQSQPAQTKTTQATVAVPTAAPAPIMVQVAAVSEQDTADLLVSALRKRGYSVGIRHEAGDNLMHVQVGPFTTRADANAMRQKLLSDGYNAIVR